MFQLSHQAAMDTAFKTMLAARLVTKCNPTECSAQAWSTTSTAHSNWEEIYTKLQKTEHCRSGNEMIKGEIFQFLHELCETCQSSKF